MSGDNWCRSTSKWSQQWNHVTIILLTWKKHSGSSCIIIEGLVKMGPKATWRIESRPRFILDRGRWHWLLFSRLKDLSAILLRSANISCDWRSYEEFWEHWRNVHSVGHIDFLWPSSDVAVSSPSACYHGNRALRFIWDVPQKEGADFNFHFWV